MRRKHTTYSNPMPVFVVGTLFSGSTLVGHELTARLDGVQYIGEMTNFLRHPIMYAPKASGVSCSVCDTRGQECPFLTEKLRQELSYDNIPRIFETMADAFNARVIVDGSKYVAWLQMALAQGFTGEPPRVILCVRNPFAFALSYRNRNDCALWEGANVWRDTYVDALRTVHQHGLAHMVVRYEDFIEEREAVVAKIGSFVAAPLLPAADYDRCHASGGNWSAAVPFVGAQQIDRVVKRQGKRVENFVAHSRSYWATSPKADERWKQLKAGELTQITQAPGLADIASLLGYDMPGLVLGTRLD